MTERELVCCMTIRDVVSSETVSSCSKCVRVKAVSFAAQTCNFLGVMDISQTEGDSQLFSPKLFACVTQCKYSSFRHQRATLKQMWKRLLSPPSATGRGAIEFPYHCIQSRDCLVYMYIYIYIRICVCIYAHGI